MKNTHLPTYPLTHLPTYPLTHLPTYPLTHLFFLFLTIFAFSNSQAQTSLQLTPSNYNGYNISCFGSATGSINLTIIGGTSPYIIIWSNAATTEDLNNVPAGYYRVTVDDADTLTEALEAEITLTQPEPLTVGEATPYVYQNGFNVSAFGACNGSVVLDVRGGVTPYTYLWEPGQQTTGSPTNLCSNENQVLVTDDNGCATATGVGLSEPERDDWTMTGNYNTNPANQFIGTLDSVDLTFKTNNNQRFRINANGTIKINSFSGGGNKTIYADSLGVLRSWTSLAPAWELLGNTIADGDFIGSLNDKPLRFVTDEFDRMNISADGRVNIGNYLDPEYGNNHIEFLVDNAIPYRRGISIGRDEGGTQDGSFNFYTHEWQNDNAGFYFKQIYENPVNTVLTRNLFSIDGQGNATIGSAPDNTFKLTVCGPIKCTRIKVEATWFDYVFDRDYKILSLASLREFINLNHHLPEIPPATEIETNGLDVGQLIGLHMKKIEELTLYVLDLHDENVALRERVKALEHHSKRKVKNK